MPEQQQKPEAGETPSSPDSTPPQQPYCRVMAGRMLKMMEESGSSSSSSGPLKQARGSRAAQQAPISSRKLMPRSHARPVSLALPLPAALMLVSLTRWPSKSQCCASVTGVAICQTPSRPDSFLDSSAGAHGFAASAAAGDLEQFDTPVSHGAPPPPPAPSGSTSRLITSGDSSNTIYQIYRAPH